MNTNTGEIHNIIEIHDKPKAPALIQITDEEQRFLQLFPANPDRRTYPKTFPYRPRALKIWRVSDAQTRQTMLDTFGTMPMEHRLKLIQKLWIIYVSEHTSSPANKKQFNTPADVARYRKAKAKKQHAKRLAKQRRKK